MLLISLRISKVNYFPLLQDISSDRLQFEYDPSESLPLSFKELELPSPVSVLETPSEEGSATGCLERLSADLKGNRTTSSLPQISFKFI